MLFIGGADYFADFDPRATCRLRRTLEFLKYAPFEHIALLFPSKHFDFAITRSYMHDPFVTKQTWILVAELVVG